MSLSPFKTRVLRALSAFILIARISISQNQPPEAVNQQDEVVQIHLLPGQGPQDVLPILRSDNKFETSRYKSEVFELRNALAYEVKLYINEAVAQEKGVVRAASTKPADGSKPRQFLLVTTTSEQLQSIAETIASLDVPGFVNSQGRSRIAYRLKYRLASDLGRILANTRLTPQAKVFADDQSNTLYYDDSEYVTKATEDYVKFYDVPPPQVEFDVQIIELIESDVGKLGLDWDAWKRVIGGQFDLTSNQFEGGERFTRLDVLLTLDANVLASFLNYTVQSGNGKLLQRTRLSASNLQPAIISDAKRVPFIDYVRTEHESKVIEEKNPQVDAAGTHDRDEPPAVGPRVVTIVPPVTNRLEDLGKDQVGLRVKIQPVIGTEAVVAAVEISVNTFNGWDPLNRPIVGSQQLTSTLGLVNGKKLLLGTIERDTKVGGRRGIPGLKDIPVLGYLFGVENTRVEKSRLFIVATPTFWNISYGARDIAQLKTAEPLVIGPFETKLEDGAIERELGELSDAPGR